MWRGGFRLNRSVAASFVWPCLRGSTVTPFPHPAHRTWTCGSPTSGLYGAFLVKGGHGTTFSFLLGFLGPFFCSTAPQAFFRPDCKMPKPTRAAAVKDGAFLPCRPKGPSRASGWSSLTTPGASRVACTFLVYMLSPLPRRSGWAYSFARPTHPYLMLPRFASPFISSCHRRPTW